MIQRSAAGRKRSSAEPAGSNLKHGCIDSATFRRKLMSWYRANGRVLPWRQTTDPYRIWVSEIMLQQTRVAAVLDHYRRFVAKFPTVVSLSLAPEDEVLAAWSGLGYYRRARMLHKAAQFLVFEHAGILPSTSAALRTLPGVGEYTAAAIASIAFGESVAVVDGNVERVILRLSGRGDDPELPFGSAARRTFVREQAQLLMPVRRILESVPATCPGQGARRSLKGWSAEERILLNAAAHPKSPAGSAETPSSMEELDDSAAAPHRELEAPARLNAAGDHNQAMMELGATVCLPRAPLCLQCPVQALCRTRGEHRTPERAAQLSRPVALMLATRRRANAIEVLVELRSPSASLMPGMYELPTLPAEPPEESKPVLRLRHAITNTNYAVSVYAVNGAETSSSEFRSGSLPVTGERRWVRTAHLDALPLTGLARKVLHRLRLMDGPAIALLR